MESSLFNYHYQGEQTAEEGRSEDADELFNQAAEYWKRAIRVAPNNYIEAQNWLKTTGRSTLDLY